MVSKRPDLTKEERTAKRREIVDKLRAIAHEDNLPLWRVENAPKCLMATTGTNSFGYDLLRYGDFQLRAALTHINLVTKIVPAMRGKLEEFEQLDKDGDN